MYLIFYFSAGFKNLTQEALLGDPELLKAILDDHVVPQRALTTAQLTTRDRLPTLADAQLLEVSTPTELPAG